MDFHKLQRIFRLLSLMVQDTYHLPFSLAVQVLFECFQEDGLFIKMN
jgi:hypothetical protein